MTRHGSCCSLCSVCFSGCCLSMCPSTLSSIRSQALQQGQQLQFMHPQLTTAQSMARILRHSLPVVTGGTALDWHMPGR
jgi:hypothetical protein